MTDTKSLISKLSGQWHGHYGTAPCPVCQPEARMGQNALTLTDGENGRLLAHCKRSGCSFHAIIAAVGIGRRHHRPSIPNDIAQQKAKRREVDEKKARQARSIWQETLPIAGTLAETYLRGRGITCPLPATLRFHPGAFHGPAARRLPALVAVVEGAAGFSIHRTYLHPDGSGKTDIAPNKMMLGAVSGGAVRLGGGPTLVLTEGIETALSLQSGLLKHPVTVWAALSASNMASLNLPPKPGRLTIAADGDTAGHAAAYALAEKAYALGWKVSLLPAPDGSDWNDVLIGKAVAA